MNACSSLLRSASSHRGRVAVITSPRPLRSVLVMHQLMGTWIDRAKRWQSGVKDTDRTSEVSLVVLGRNWLNLQVRVGTHNRKIVTT